MLITESLKPKFNVKTSIYESMLREKRDKTSHYPSGIRIEYNNEVYGQCLRKLYYDFKNIEQSEIPEHGLLKMEMGNAIHNFIARQLREYLEKNYENVSLTEEFELEYREDWMDYPIRGRIDCLVEAEDLRFAVEVKSTYGGGRKSIFSEGAPPKIEHVMQAALYLFIMQKLEKPLTFISLIYIARDNGLMKEYIIREIDSELLEEILIEKLDSNKVIIAIDERDNLFVFPFMRFDLVLDSIKKIEYHVKNEIVPERDYNKEDWQCRYCPYNNICWGESDGWTIQEKTKFVI